MGKRVSDEQLLEALLVHGGASGAAAAHKISRNAVYKRLQDPTFRAQYDAAQGAIVGAATAAMTAALDDAIGALVNVLNDYNTAPATKVQAANTLLTHCNRYIETASILHRLELLEQNAKSDNH